ncbi:MAG: hypothetical protein ACI81L_002684 [Verrucomicrobiales bacterium]|jgi:hypothetical protein
MNAAGATWGVRRHLARTIGDDFLVLANDSEHRPLRLNSAARTVLFGFTGGASTDDVVRSTAPPNSIDRWRQDVVAIVEQLRKERLLTSNPQEFPQLVAQVEAGNGRPAVATGNALDHKNVEKLWTTLSGFGRSPAAPRLDLRALNAEESLSLIDDVERSGGLGLLAHAADTDWIKLSGTDRDLVQERWAANQMHCLLV